MADSAQQYSALTLLTGTLKATAIFTPDHYSTLAAKITVHFSRLLRRTDQCKGLLMCSILYWENPGWPADGGRKAAKVVERARDFAVSVKDKALAVGLL